MSSSTGLGEVTLRKPKLADGKAIHQLIESCPPLDLNSEYNYYLLSSHFAQTCVVVERKERIVGFLSAYLRPDEVETLFIWQVAVDEQVRGQGIAGLMLSSLLARPECKGVRSLETTVGPSNAASRNLFTSFSRSRGFVLVENQFLDADAFTEGHEPEQLLRIGPLNLAASIKE